MADFGQQTRETWSASAARHAWLVVSLLCAWPVHAFAADDGPTLPISAVLAERLPDISTTLVSDLAADYPIDTPGMHPGRLAQPVHLTDGASQWLAQPIALVGDDERSRTWLLAHSAMLGRLQARVLVVQVDSPEHMRLLRQLQPDLAMAPAAVPELAQQLAHAGAAVYPLLLMPDGKVLQAPEGESRPGARDE